MATHTTHRVRAMSAIGIVAMLCLFVAGCGTGGSSSGIVGGPGVNLATKTITLGILTPLSGPVAAPIGIPLTAGIQTYFDAVNANGGIDGYKIVLTEKDTQYDPTLEVEGYNEIKNNVAMFAESLGTPTTAAIVNQTNTDKVLVSAATLDSYLAREQYMVLVGTPYRLQVENAFDYVVNTLHVSNPKTAIIYQNDSYGQDGLTGYNEAVSYYHMDNVGEATYNATDTTFTAPAAKIAATGAKYVFLTAVPAAAAGIIATAAALGYTPQWILQSPAFATQLMAVPGLSELLAAHAWVVGQGALWGDTTQPGMVEMLKDIQQYDPSQGPNAFFEFGFAESIVTDAILTKAIQDGDLSRAGLLKAFNSLGSVDVGGLLPTLHYGSAANQRVPSRDNRIFAISPTNVGNVMPLTPDFTGAAAQASNF